MTSLVSGREHEHVCVCTCIYMYITCTCIYMYITCTCSKPLRLLYSLIIYEIVNFSFFTLYSLLLLSFFLYLKSVPIYVIVHVYMQLGSYGPFNFCHAILIITLIIVWCV